MFCFSSRRRHTRCALVTGVQTCALPISSVFEFGVPTLRADTDPVYPVRKSLPQNKTQHKRPLSSDEIGKLLQDVDGHGGNYQTQCAFNLMWLTLARPTEVVEAEWSEIDLDAGLWRIRSEEHTSELQSLMRTSYAVFCLKKTTN